MEGFYKGQWFRSGFATGLSGFFKGLMEVNTETCPILVALPCWMMFRSRDNFDPV